MPPVTTIKKDPALEAFAKRFREIRLKNGYETQKALAKAIDKVIREFDPEDRFTQQNIANIEGGWATPSIKTWKAISRVLRIKLVVSDKTLEIIEF